MGLKICHRILENNGGTIDVYSAGKDKGATFMFSVKMKLPPTSPMIEEQKINQIVQETPGYDITNRKTNKN